ncbi:MAG: 50S ribosomal protein L21 [Cyanobacteria bacterium J06638_22]
MGYAIIETGGQQFRVEVGRFYDVDRIHADEDSKLTLDKVLFVESDGDASIGQPLVEGAAVEATVMRHLRGRKIIVYKMRPKKKTRKKQGHRQELTRLMIDAITLNGTAIAGNAEVADTPVAAATTEAPVDAAPEAPTEAPATEEA